MKTGGVVILDFGLARLEQIQLFSQVGGWGLTSFNIAVVVLEKSVTVFAVLRKWAWQPSQILDWNTCNKFICAHRQKIACQDISLQLQQIGEVYRLRCFTKMGEAAILDFGSAHLEQIQLFSQVGGSLPSFNFIAVIVLKKFIMEFAILRKWVWRPSWILDQNAMKKFRCPHRQEVLAKFQLHSYSSFREVYHRNFTIF